MAKKRPSNLSAALLAGRLAARNLIRRDDSDRQMELADLLSNQLDEMKGLAMKLGQIVSYMDVPLPPEVQARLANLQVGAKGRPLSELVSIFEKELGAGPDRLFDTLEETPIAAASIGQVHRGILHGRRVAVKVQYPEVARGFEKDLSLVNRFAGLASLASSVDGKAIVRELSTRLAEECDYEREAKFQAIFAQNFRGDHAVVVPLVLPERSCKSILTTAFIEAESFQSFSERADAEERGGAAEVLMRFSYQSLFRHRLIQADPHPGNFSFLPGGAVVFFDYGCVKEIERWMTDALGDLARGLIVQDRNIVRKAAFDLRMVGNEKKFDHDEFYEMMRHLFLPFLEARFTFTPDYVKRAMEFNGPRSKNVRHLAMPPDYVWVARLKWGLWSVMNRLRVSGDFRYILHDALAHADQDSEELFPSGET